MLSALSIVEVDGLPYCVKCGAPVKEEDTFCAVCGAAVAKFTREEFSVSASNLVDRVKELLHEGNVTRVLVKDEKGKVLLEIPATVGVIGVVLVPWLAALGVIATLVTNCRIVVERRE
jgi:predicted regulator of Ras-like GTPase activity (Roadblock/LC7/MglB family)